MSYDRASVRAVLDRVKADGRGSLNPAECLALCAAYGIAIPREALALSASDAARMAAEIGFPVVMKVVSPEILHKTEAGGVVVGVRSAAEAEEAYAAIVRNANAHKPGVRLEGVQIQRMLAGGCEVL